MNEMVTIPKGEYRSLTAIEEDMADLNSAANILARTPRVVSSWIGASVR